MVAYQNQGYVLNQELINKPKFLGMSPQEVENLLVKLRETGSHLVLATERLKTTILSAEAQSTPASSSR